MKKSMSFYTGLMKEAIEADKDKVALYSEIDMHYGGQWQVPAALKALPWIKNRKFASTKPADAIDSGARTFASLFPKVSIAPLSDDPNEYGRVELLETAVDWEFRRMNMGGGKTTHWKILDSAMKYCAVSMQTEYLPHTLKGQEKNGFLKEVMRQSKFQWTIHHPGSVKSRRARGVLTMALLAVVKTGAEILEEFGEGNAGVQEMLEKLRDGRGRPSADRLMKTRFSFYDLTDWDMRCIYIVDNGGSLQVNPNPAKGIELRYEEHKLPFIPWVVVDNEDPILKNSIRTGGLDNENIVRTILFSKGIASAAESKTNIQTPDGTLDGVSIDNTNPTQPMVTRPGVTVQELRGTPIDPQLSSLLQMFQSENSASLVTQVLSDAASLDSRNFSTANMKYKTAVAQLSLAKNAAARAEELGFYQMFQWLDYAKDKPLVTFRDKSKTFMGKELAAGQEIKISPDEEMADAENFDLEHLYITVELREDSLLDEQSKWNLGVNQVDRFGMSRQIVAEQLGVENYGLHEQKRASEELVLASVQAQARKIMAEAEAYAAELMSQVQIQTQQAMMEMEQAQMAQQQPQPEPQNDVQGMNAGGSFASMQGQDLRGGGAAAMQVAPGEGREQINGEDMMGRGLA
jgi:hypothetical protein